MPVTYVGTGISLETSPTENNEIFPYYPTVVSDGEISSEMPVLTEETGISQEISP